MSAADKVERSRGALAVLLALLIVVCLGLSAQTALADGPGTLVSAGFEDGTDGATLSSPWALVRHPAARRVRQRPGQERLAVGLDPGTDDRRLTPEPTRPPRAA